MGELGLSIHRSGGSICFGGTGGETRALGAFVGISFGRFLGSEVKDIMTTVSRFGLFCSDLFSSVLVLSVLSGGGHSLPLPAPSGPSSSSSYINTKDSFAIRVLLEPFSDTEMEGTSVNQPEARLSANAVASSGEEAGPANQTPRAVPYPYQPDEKAPFPSSEMIEMAQIQAEDLFEVKVEIIKLMAGLDPTGDWMGRGTRALENSRTSTGECSLEKLYEKLEDMQRGGVQSSTFWEFKKGKMLLRIDSDENSSA
ncbi:hypothetical protein M9H77_16565 [Catharanthus roseus]|uniref:Uncharacterized protein n=1 Tax=Catharanthus roseus TaxID=4058 RepID=A0ACC0B2A8_CATRO|nr:hypothetical protein M9H77_16565 [Catharanthus roseus]